MNTIAGLVEKCWLWTYTAGMPPEEADDRRAEIESDWWEYAQFAAERPHLAGGRLRRLFAGAADDIAWRASFGRDGLSLVRNHETMLLVALLGLVFFSIPVSAWWVISLAGNPDQPSFQLWYIGTEALALFTTVVGGAVSAAYYQRTGRALMLLGSVALAATLWWTPILAGIILAAALTTVLSLPARGFSDAPLPN